MSENISNVYGWLSELPDLLLAIAGVFALMATWSFFYATAFLRRSKRVLGHIVGYEERARPIDNDRSDDDDSSDLLSTALNLFSNASSGNGLGGVLSNIDYYPIVQYPVDSIIYSKTSGSSVTCASPLPQTVYVLYDKADPEQWVFADQGRLAAHSATLWMGLVAIASASSAFYFMHHPVH